MGRSKVPALEDERRARIAAAKAILDNATAEKRGLTAEERNNEETISKEIDALDAKIAETRRAEAADRRDLESRLAALNGGEVVTAETATLGREQSVRDWLSARGELDRSAPNPDAAKYLRGILTGDWKGAEELRAMSEGTSSAGGYLVPTPLAASVIDKARALTRVFQAGARTVPMDSSTLKVARVTADPTVSWVAEGTTLTPSQPTLDLVTFNAQAAAALVVCSRQLLEDSAPNAAQVIESVIAKAVAVEIDKTALRGTGTGNQPTGLLNTSGVQTISVATNGLNPAYGDLLTAVQKVRDANYEPTPEGSPAVIMAPRSARQLSASQDAQGRWLGRPDDLAKAQFLTTTTVPVNDTQGSSSSASAAYLGAWENLWIGMRNTLQIQVLQERFADALQVGFLAWFRMDVQAAHPDAFCVVKGWI